MKQGTFLILASILITMTACNNNKKTTLNSGINKSYLDESVSPAQDFYQYACGGWMKLHPLSGEYARYGSFDKLAEDKKTIERINQGTLRKHMKSVFLKKSATYTIWVWIVPHSNNKEVCLSKLIYKPLQK